MSPTQSKNHLSKSGISNDTDRNKFDTLYFLQRFIAALESTTSVKEITAALLSCIQNIVQTQDSVTPSFVALINNQDLSLKINTVNPQSTSALDFELELKALIESGIIAWCLTNHRVAFTQAEQSALGQNCMILPLYTINKSIGLAIFFVDNSEADFSRDSLEVIKIACMQCALFIDNLTMYRDLQNTQSKLLHSEKLSAIGQLAAGIAHEINNPLSFVRCNLEVLSNYIKTINTFWSKMNKANCMADIQKSYNELDIDFIASDIINMTNDNIQGIERASLIISNLKDFAHIDNYHIKGLANIEDHIAKTLQIANNELKYSIAVITKFGDISPVNCNIGEINQVVLNIIINAAQALKTKSDNKNKTIHIKTSENESFATIEISDNGPGIPDDILPKIFDPFFTTKPVGEGTGLGLNIAYDIIVNKHNGEIFAKNNQDEGVCFTIHLPKSNKY
jgi:signal transduction histidine kinase